MFTTQYVLHVVSIAASRLSLRTRLKLSRKIIFKKNSTHTIYK